MVNSKFGSLLLAVVEWKPPLPLLPEGVLYPTDPDGTLDVIRVFEGVVDVDDNDGGGGEMAPPTPPPLPIPRC